MSLRGDFIAFDDLLASKGVPPLTEWWRSGIGAWLDAYETGDALELWACVGRGAAKSTALYKIGLFFTLFGDFDVPAGERHYAIVLSRLKEEAGKGISILGRWLTLLGVAHRPAGDVIDLANLPRGIRVVAASVAAASGWRAFFVGKDERSKWPTSGIDDLDSAEIDASAAAMTATHSKAPVLAFGSAWGDFGPFYDAVMGGTTQARVVLGPTPTWVAAPHITIESLRRKFPDERIFAREAECVFQSGATSALDPDLVRAAMRTFRRGAPISAPAMGFDSSMGRGDSTAWLIAQWWQPTLDEEDLYDDEEISPGVRVISLDARGLRRRKPNAPPRPKPELVVYAIGSLQGRFAERGVTSDEVVAHAAGIARGHGVQHIWSDQYQGFALQSAFARHRITYVPQVWSVESKAEALLRLRTWLRDGALSIEQTAPAQTLVSELLNLQETIRPSGSIGLAARRGHDDLACALLSIAMCDGAGGMAGSPIAVRRGLMVDAPGEPTRHFGVT